MNILISTVGDNALPVYIVMKYLFNELRKDVRDLPVPDKSYLIVSKHTKKYFDIIKDLFGNSCSDSKITCINIQENENNPGQIMKEVTEELKKDFKKENIMFNFTGGTKIMSVFTYEAIKDFGAGEIKMLYLDAEKNKIKVYEKNTNEISVPEDKSLMDYFQDFTVENLCSLHEIKQKDSINEIEEDKIINKNKSQIDNYFKDKEKQNPEKDKIINEIDNYFKDKEEYHLYDYINSTDFEKYIYAQTSNILKGMNLDNSKIIHSFKGKKTKEKDFEVDILVLMGNRVVLISCTTSDDEKKCKQKFFEVIFRAQQIGGDYAKVILVCCLPDDRRKKFEEDLESFDSSYYKSSKIFYENDLKEVDNKLKEYFKQINK